MKKSLRVISFLITMVLCNLANAQLQDIITLKKIEVYGQPNTSNVTFYKNLPVTIKVSYSVLKQTTSYSNIASSAYFVADMAAGAPYQIHVHSGPGFPVTYGQSGEYEFYTQVQNASMLIKSYNSGNLYLRLTSSNGGVMAYSNKFTSSFADPTVLNNTITGGGLVEYMGAGPYIAGSIPTVMPPVGTVKYYWQKRQPSAPASSNLSWSNIDVNSLNYIPSGTVNMKRYFIRRAVQTEHFGTFFSNEVEVKVNIGGNNLELKVDPTNSLYIQGLYPGGGEDGLPSMSYQWQEKINSVWTNIPTTIDNRHKLVIPSTAVSKYYRRIVSSPGVADNVSNEIVITPGIYGNTIYKTQNQTLGVIYEGDKIMPGQIPQMNRLVTYMFDGKHYSTEDPMIFQWQKKEEGGVWQDITGANSEVFNVNTPLYVGTEFRRKSSTPNLGDNYSNSVNYVISQFPAVTSNNIQFDTGNVQNIIGSVPTGGDGNYEYHWVVDTLPDESIGALPGMVNTQNATIDALASTYPINMDEYYFTRYVVSDGVWQPSNTIKYSYTNGILLKQALAKNLKTYANGTEKKILVTENKGEILFSFKNYNKENVQIHLMGLKGMSSEKILTTTINNDSYVSNWQIPVNYLPGVYIYKIIFNNGEVKSGKVVLKK